MATNGVFGLLSTCSWPKNPASIWSTSPAAADLHDFTDQIAKQAMEAIQQAVANNAAAPAVHHGNGSGPAPISMIETPQVATVSPREKVTPKAAKKDGV